MPDEFEVTARTVGLVVNAPDIFERADFMVWLNDQSSATATWHRRGKEPTEYSDVFVLIDSTYEGDSSDMPEDIWKSLCDLAYREFCGGEPDISRYPSQIVVRLTNLET
jgi:hypothetical protein